MQKIDIVYVGKHPGFVKVDGFNLLTGELYKLITNDGFDSLEDFFRWFNKDFSGSILHWTDLRY